ncbi:hypothetical protein JQX08_08630 [Pseudomonas sp. UL073]|uniref:Response regulatory domain-containing protein n=1 Tax=Zestomonas insulae TaxID=2809017 RepID=A0ABS2ICD7_9GAMM|nr:hypothetical protein [Pseudomonas insulae]MBM7060774.1 hypothetical protein [Pseudomonas insulae]
MRLLVIEENAFASHDVQLLANGLGIFSIHVHATLAQALKDAEQRNLDFDVALLHQAEEPFTDLQNLHALHHRLRARHLLLMGVYGGKQREGLVRAARLRRLPLLDILDLPLSRPQMFQALQRIPGFIRHLAHD